LYAIIVMRTYLVCAYVAINNPEGIYYGIVFICATSTEHQVNI